MHRISVAIWETDEWSEESTFSTFILLPKKGDLKQCKNYRASKQDSSSDHTGKDLSELKTDTETADKQAGFRQGRGTRDQITNLRILMHKARKHQQPLYMCFEGFKRRSTLSLVISCW